MRVLCIPCKQEGTSDLDRVVRGRKVIEHLLDFADTWQYPEVVFAIHEELAQSTLENYGDRAIFVKPELSLIHI